MKGGDILISIEKVSYYDVDDVAEIVGVCTKTIRRDLKDGLLKGLKIGRMWYFTFGDILDYREERNGKNRGSKSKP